MNITIRILLAFFFVLGGGFYYFVDQISGDIRHRYQEVLEESLNDQAHILASLVEEEMGENQPYIKHLDSLFTRTYRRKLSASIYDLKKESVNLRVYVTDQNGIVLFDSIHPENQGKDFSRWNDVYLTLRGKYGARSTRTNPDDPYSGAIFVAAPITKDGKPVGVITVAKPKDSIVQTVQAARSKLFRVAGVVGTSMVVTFLLFFFWITMPIHRLTRYAHQLRRNRRVPFPRVGGGEFKELGLAFEQMRTELEGRRYIEKYIQTLTHEIKSPLTSIKGAAELLDEEMPADTRRRFMKNIRSESSRIEEIVGRLLGLASIENQKSLREVVEIQVESLLQEVASAQEPELHRKNLELKIQIPRPFAIHGERFLLHQALGNLVQNAIRFANPGSTIHLGATIEEDGFAHLSVRNQGEPIPQFAESRIFERFYSLPGKDHGKSTGLGLPFVQEVAELHGGQVQVFNIQGGVESLLILPPRPPAQE